MTEPSINPYESPLAVQTVAENPGRARAVNLLRGPTLGLIALALIHLIGAALLIGIVAYVHLQRVRAGAPNARLPEIPPWTPISLLGCVFVAWTAWTMRQLRSLWLCRIGAFVACIPFVSPLGCAAMPFGLWAAIVLFLPSVVKEFDRPPVENDEVTD